VSTFTYIHCVCLRMSCRIMYHPVGIAPRICMYLIISHISWERFRVSWAPCQDFITLTSTTHNINSRPTKVTPRVMTTSCFRFLSWYPKVAARLISNRTKFARMTASEYAPVPLHYFNTCGCVLQRQYASALRVAIHFRSIESLTPCRR